MNAKFDLTQHVALKDDKEMAGRIIGINHVTGKEPVYTLIMDNPEITADGLFKARESDLEAA